MRDADWEESEPSSGSFLGLFRAKERVGVPISCRSLRARSLHIRGGYLPGAIPAPAPCLKSHFRPHYFISIDDMTRNGYTVPGMLTYAHSPVSPKDRVLQP
jgi:hypothetical protein